MLKAFNCELNFEETLVAFNRALALSDFPLKQQLEFLSWACENANLFSQKYLKFIPALLFKIHSPSTHFLGESLPTSPLPWFEGFTPLLWPMQPFEFSFNGRAQQFGSIFFEVHWRAFSHSTLFFLLKVQKENLKVLLTLDLTEWEIHNGLLMEYKSPS